MGEGVLLDAMGGVASAVIVISFLLLRFFIRKVYKFANGDGDKAVSQGKLAYQNGIGVNDNPYSATEKALYDSWSKGWYLSEKAIKKLKANKNGVGHDY